MAVVIAMLRGVNVGGYQKIKMEELRTLCGSLELRDAQTYIQSGNVVFREDSAEPGTLARRLEDGIEKTFGFRPDVMVRTPSELRKVIAKNPFAGRSGIDPSRLLVSFMASAPTPQARDKVLALPCDPEELRIQGRELYVYYPNGMARPKISMARIEKVLQRSATGRNLNTVLKLMAMAEILEASG
jgi:uncharacterized protein (DUF1697 family)